jgi:hypothetical protein
LAYLSRNCNWVRQRASRLRAAGPLMLRIRTGRGKAARRRSGCLALDVLVCLPGRDLDRGAAAHPRARRLAPNVDGSPWRDPRIGAPKRIPSLRRRNSEAIRRLHISATARDRGRTRGDGFRLLFGGGFRPRHRDRSAECQCQSQPVSCSHLTLPGVVLDAADCRDGTTTSQPN